MDRGSFLFIYGISEAIGKGEKERDVNRPRDLRAVLQVKAGQIGDDLPD